MDPNSLRSKSQLSEDDIWSGIVRPSSIGGIEPKSKSPGRMTSGSAGHSDSGDHEEYPEYPSSPPDSSPSTFSGTQSDASRVACMLMDSPVIDNESAGVKGPQCEEDDDGDSEDLIDSVGEKRLDAIESAGDTRLL